MALRSHLDRFLYRHPFEGASAARYAGSERPAFGDLDARLVERWRGVLHDRSRVLDLGAGPGDFSRALLATHPRVRVVALEPSRHYSRTAPAAPPRLRAAAEAIPLADGAVDVAVCLSSIRHVRERAAALRELRRVVAPGGHLFVVELDPHADRRRAREHARRLGSRLLRAAFGPLVLRTAPPAADIAATARDGGWRVAHLESDTIQPVYLMHLQ